VTFVCGESSVILTSVAHCFLLQLAKESKKAADRAVAAAKKVLADIETAKRVAEMKGNKIKGLGSKIANLLKAATEDAINSGKEISAKALADIQKVAIDTATEANKFVEDKTSEALNEANEASKKMKASLEKGMTLVQDQAAEKMRKLQDDVIEGAQKAVTDATNAINDAPKKLAEAGNDLVLAAKETGAKAKADMDKAAELVGKVVVAAGQAGKLAVGVTKLALLPAKNFAEAAADAANKVRWA